MGIYGLSKLIKTYAPKARVDFDLHQLNGKKVGIDASIFIYQLYAIGESRHIYNKDQPINHIQGLFYKTSKLLQYGAIPCFVFDGKPPLQKSEVLQIRKKARDSGKAIRIPRFIFEQCRDLLKTMEIVVIDAVGEAEAELATMAKNKIIDYVISEDLDTLVFGAPFVITRFDLDSGSPQCITLDVLLAELKMNHTMFIELCVLLGCDYTKHVSGHGPKFCLDKIRQYGSLAKWIESTNNTHDDMMKACELFVNPNVIGFDPKLSLTRYSPTVGWRVMLYQYLVDAGLSTNRITNTLDQIEKLVGYE